MVRNCFLAVTFTLLGACAPGQTQDKTVPLKFSWPAGMTYGYFSIRSFTDREGVGKAGAKENEAFQVAVPDGEYPIMVGLESATLRVQGNEVSFVANPDLGVALSPDSKEIVFSTVPLTIDASAIPYPLTLEGSSEPLVPPGTKKDITLVPSRYRLQYPFGRVELVVRPDGTVFIQGGGAGFKVEGKTIRANPARIEVKPIGNIKQWSVARYDNQNYTADAVIKLLPGDYRPLVVGADGKRLNVRFLVGDDLRISLPTGPWTESLSLTGEGGWGISVGQVGGEAIAQARTAAAAESLKQQQAFLALAEKAPWKQEFRVQDYMGWYDYPSELLSYQVNFQGDKILPESLQLVDLSDGAVRQIPFQLENRVPATGPLKSATVSFRSDLPRNGARRFLLTSGLPPAGTIPNPEAVQISPEGKNVVLRNDKFAVRIPAGDQTFESPKSLSSLPAPLIAISRDVAAGRWVGAGSFQAPVSLRVKSLTSKTTVQGPLLTVQRVTYTLASGGTYAVDISLRAGDNFVTVDEYLNDLRPGNEAYFRFNLDTTLNPDERQSMGNGGYKFHSGKYDARLAGDGQLPFELGLNVPNSAGLTRTAAFWNSKGQDVLILAINRMKDWKTANRLVWYQGLMAGNLRFYSKDTEKYMQTRLEGKERHWAIGLTPKDRDVPGGYLVDIDGAGPEIRLWQKLTDFSLNSYKDWNLDWDESLKPLHDDGQTKPVTFDQWMYGSDGPRAKNIFFWGRIPKVFWDYSAEVAPVSFRATPAAYRSYAASRTSWTLEQRKQARAFLIFLAESCADDTNMPHTSMLSGQPNFLMDVKQVLPIACATFPNYPGAKAWRAEYGKFLNEFLDVYQRKPNPDFNAVGGRWTENVACYSGTVLLALEHSAEALQDYDGTDLMADPRLQNWIRWYRDVMTSPQDGKRRVPPEGAHATAMEPGSTYSNALFSLAKQMGKSNPQLSAEMRWIETNGAEGQKPNLKSVLVNDHGGFLRYDFGGANEAYLHMMQISGRWNYRWGRGADMLYYGAKGKLWSYNGPEDAGDNFNLNNLTSFQVAGLGLGPHDTDQLLYDFGFAQFYRSLSNPDTLLVSGYSSRATMMLRDDYIAIYDDVADDNLDGTFTWSAKWDMPQIYQLKPGSQPVEDSIQQTVRGEPEPIKINLKRYKGKGDFLTVVAPATVDAQRKEYGASVNGENVFLGDKASKLSTPGNTFDGTAGYSRVNQLAIFEGKSISFKDFGLSRDGGDFGVSAEVKGKVIQGRFTGKEGGKVTITLPAGFDAAKAKVKVNGQPVAASVEAKTLSFPIVIRQADGTKDYVVTFD